MKKKPRRVRRTRRKPASKPSNGAFYGFLVSGLAFLAAGLAIHIDALTIVGVAFVAIGLESLNWFRKK